MPDQAVATATPRAAVPAGPESSTAATLEQDGDRVAPVISLDEHRRRSRPGPSPATVAACRAVHPSQLWALNSGSGDLEGLATPS